VTSLYPFAFNNGMICGTNDADVLGVVSWNKVRMLLGFLFKSVFNRFLEVVAEAPAESPESKSQIMIFWLRAAATVRTLLLYDPYGGRTIAGVTPMIRSKAWSSL